MSAPLVAVVDFLALAGVIGGLVWRGWQASSIVFLLLALGGVGQAAYRLQRQEDERSAPRFSLDALPIEFLGNAVPTPADGRRWSDISAMWIEVKNQGPAARFAARIENVSRVRRLGTNEIRDDYSGFQAAWEDTNDRDWMIFRNNAARLKIAWHGRFSTDAETGRATWFWTPPTTSWGSVGWRLQPLDGQIRFNLTVTNLDTDAQITETFVMEFDDHDALTAFLSTH